MKKTGRFLISIYVGLFVSTLLIPLMTQSAFFIAAINTASEYCTLVGGSNIEDATKIAFDQDGNIVLIGQTQSDDLDVTTDAVQDEYGGGTWDSYVAKFNDAGGLLFCTYLGGIDYEHVTSVNFDSDNHIVLTGTTGSPDFPVTPDAYQSTIGGNLDGFITILLENGSLLYSSFFGGTGEDWIYGIEFDASGNLMFGGFTSSDGLATSGVYQNARSSSHDVFAAKLSADGSSKLVFTYLGGSSSDRGWSMTVDASFNFIISGLTQSSNLPTTDGAFQESYGGGSDAFIAVISEDGESLQYLTYFGGSGEDMGLGLDVDSEGNLILVGPTESNDIPVANALQEAFAGGSEDIYVAQFDVDGTPNFVTYLGGNSTDRAWDCRVDNDDNIVIVGRTISADFPAVEASQSVHAGSYDTCVTKLSSDGQSILMSTFLGGSLSDIGEGIAIDLDGNVVVSGSTSSDDFPTTEGAYDEELGGFQDSFICHTAFLTETTPTAPTTTDETQLEDSPLPIIVGFAAVVILVAVIIISKKRS